MGGDFDLTKITDGLDRWTTKFEYTGSTGSVDLKLQAEAAEENGLINGHVMASRLMQLILLECAGRPTIRLA